MALAPITVQNNASVNIYAHTYTHYKKAIEQITTLFETNKEQQRNFKKLTAVVAIEPNVVIFVAMVIGFPHWSARQQVQCAPLPILFLLFSFLGCGIWRR